MYNDAIEMANDDRGNDPLGNEVTLQNLDWEISLSIDGGLDTNRGDGVVLEYGVVSGEIDALRVKGCPSVNT